MYYKYRSVKNLKEIDGFIVNIHDSINFDIDLDFDEELKNIYKDVIKNTYEYISLNDKQIRKNTDFSKLSVKKRVTYRCRLKGIAINKNFRNKSEFYKISGKILQQIRMFINSNDSWVICYVSDIDVHRRLLIDMKVVFDDKIIDLKEFILSKTIGNDNIYVEYKIN